MPYNSHCQDLTTTVNPIPPMLYRYWALPAGSLSMPMCSGMAQLPMWCFKAASASNASTLNSSVGKP